MAALEHAIGGADKTENGICLALADIDHFKSINDRFGHDAGDSVLKHFARIVSSGLRKTDIVGRVGGEEFAILMRCKLNEAKATCERLLRTISGEPIAIGREQFFITVSLGLAEHTFQKETTDQLIKRTDIAMYCAKENGRNRLHVAENTSDRRKESTVNSEQMDDSLKNTYMLGYRLIRPQPDADRSQFHRGHDVGVMAVESCGDGTMVLSLLKKHSTRLHSL